MTHLSPDARRLIARTRHGDDPSVEDERRIGRSLARRVRLTATALTVGIGATGAAKSAAATGLAVGWSKMVVCAVVGVGVAVAVTVPLGAPELNTAVRDRATPRVGAQETQQASSPNRRTGAESMARSGIAEPLRTPAVAGSLRTLDTVKPSRCVAESDAAGRGTRLLAQVTEPLSDLTPASPAPLASPLVRGGDAALEPTVDAGPAVARFTAEPATPSDRLASETAALRSVQGALRSGNPAHALDLIDQQNAQYSDGALSQERAAARIFALCSLRRSAEAHAEIKRFMQRWPRSPMLGRVRDACPKQ